MKNLAIKSVLSAAAISLLGSSVWAGDYGYGNSYGYKNYDHKYEKKKSYNKQYHRKRYSNQNKAAHKTRGFKTGSIDKSLPHLTDKKGMALYIFDKDKYGVSNCYSDCTLKWPPYVYKKGGKAKQNYSVIVRKDGLRQWAYKGQPLYYWAGDQKPGDVNGDGVGGVWHAPRSKQFKKVVSQEPKPSFLTDEKKMTLYIFDKDKEGVSNCYKDCAVSWPPYLAPEKAQTRENFTLVPRKDGSQQWAFKGQPLYYWAGDQNPGDATGDGVGGVWHIIKL